MRKSSTTACVEQCITQSRRVADQSLLSCLSLCHAARQGTETFVEGVQSPVTGLAVFIEISSLQSRDTKWQCTWEPDWYMISARDGTVPPYPLLRGLEGNNPLAPNHYRFQVLMKLFSRFFCSSKAMKYWKRELKPIGLTLDKQLDSDSTDSF